MLVFEKLFVEAEDFPPHPLHPPEGEGGADGKEGGEYGPLGGVQPGGVSVKGPGPVGVIIRCIVSYSIQVYKLKTENG